MNFSYTNRPCWAACVSYKVTNNFPGHRVPSVFFPIKSEFCHQKPSFIIYFHYWVLIQNMFEIGAACLGFWRLVSNILEMGKQTIKKKYSEN